MARGDKWQAVYDKGSPLQNCCSRPTVINDYLVVDRITLFIATVRTDDAIYLSSLDRLQLTSLGLRGLVPNESSVIGRIPSA